MSDGSVLFGTETAYGTADNRTTTTVTDAEGRWVTHYSDGFGRLVQVSEPGSIDTSYTYTARGELETVTDDDGNLTTIDYDLLGRKTGMVDPDMGTWSYEYDDNSRLKFQTDGRGVTLSFFYDDLGRITQRKQGSTVLAEWSYGTTDTTNQKGRLVKSRINGNDTDAVVEYDAYDPDGNLLSQDLTIAGVSFELDFTYFNGGAVEDVVYPLVPGAGSREIVTVTFDGLGHPYDLQGAQSYVDAASWTAAGQPAIWEFGTGDVTRRWDYDPQTLRVAQLKAGTSQISGTATVNLMRLEYSYDDSGNVTRILDYRNSSQYECYGYDTHNRLAGAFTGDSSCASYASTGFAPFDHDYGYDDLHNLTSLDGPTYSYGTGNEAGSGDAGPHAVVAIGSNLTFGYDDSGNRVTKTDDTVVTSYSYDSENRLESVDLPGDSDDVVFVYDADGRRVSRTHGNHSTVYVAGVMEIDRTGSTVTETRTFYGFAGTPVAVRTHTAAATVFLFQNHLGSTVAAYNDTSNSHIKQYYYPYGAERHQVGTLPLDQRYTGQTSDATGADSGDTGLLFYNARYYDPDVGVFVAADTIVPTGGLSVGLNRYGYVTGNPTRFIDPSGRANQLYNPGPLIDGRDWDRIVFMGGVTWGRDDDTGYAAFLSETTGRDVTALELGEHRPQDVYHANALLGACDNQLFPNCAGVDDDSHLYAEQILEMARLSPTGMVDIVAWSYSAFEISIVLGKHPEAKAVVDRVILLSATQVDRSGFNGMGSDVTVVYEADDPVRLAPFPRLPDATNPLEWNRPVNDLVFGNRLHLAYDLEGAIIHSPDVRLGLNVLTAHNGWFGDQGAMTLLLRRLVTRL